LGHPGIATDGFLSFRLFISFSLTQELAHEKEHHQEKSGEKQPLRRAAALIFAPPMTRS
jgi:hypothetical protein